MYICILSMKRYFTLQLLLLLHLLVLSKSHFLLPIVNENGKWGYIDTTGAQILPYQYDLAYHFTDGRALVAVTVNGEYKYSFIDVKGNLYGNWNYTDARPFNNGYALVRFFSDPLNLSWGFIDTSATLARPLNCLDARSFSSGFAAINKFSGWGFVNKNFKEVIVAQYSAVGSFSEGLCAVAQGKDTLQRWAYINSLGHQVIQFKYIYASGFSNHLAAACIEVEEKQMRKTIKRKKFGYLGGNGDFMIPAIYDEASDFSEELARVKKDNFEFFIDGMGATVISLDSGVHASGFHQGFAAVNAPDGRAYFIDTHGNIAFDYNFVSLADFNNGYAFFIKRNGIQGYLDSNGVIIWKSR